MRNKLSTINQLLKPFLHRLVTVGADGFSIEGSLWRVDHSQGHDGLGNLILSDKTLVRGNQVQVICVDRRHKT